MRRVPGRLRTCAERRLGACLCRLGYGNLADCSSPRSAFVADINLSIPKERGWDGIIRLDESVSDKEPNNTVLARRVSLDPASHGFGDRDSAVKLPTHEEQEAEDK